MPAAVKKINSIPDKISRKPHPPNKKTPHNMTKKKDVFDSNKLCKTLEYEALLKAFSFRNASYLKKKENMLL